VTPAPDAFVELIRRVRAGDARAAEELVRQYEPIIRVHVRTRLTSTSVSRLFESMDICQSVMASFFTRVALGQYDLAEPRQLVALLVRMAQNKLASKAGKVLHQQKLLPPQPGGEEVLQEVPGDEHDPGRIVAGQELLAIVQARLSPEERDLADRRGRGQTWEEIARELGGTAQARRKQLGRALNRVAADMELDLDEEDE
jgi:RNA polymerase sigma-70 factor (ECF subfamily)